MKAECTQQPTICFLHRESTLTSESEKEKAAHQQSFQTQSALISEKDKELDSLRNEVVWLFM